MEQSDKIKQVLDSKEFQAWIPEDRFYLELTVVANAVFGFLACGLISAIFTAMTMHDRDYGLYFLKLIGVTIILFPLYCFLTGFGRSRIVRFNREGLEIGTSKLVFVNCPWEDVVEVRKAGNLAWEVVTKDGSAKVYWSILDMTGQGYSVFLRDVFTAMANGYSGSDLSKYRLPVSLEEGQKYEYRIPKPQIPGAPVLIVLGAVMIFLTVEKIIQGHYTDIMTGISGLTFFLMVFLVPKSVRDNSEGVLLSVENGFLTVSNPKKGLKTVPLTLVSGRLMPGVNPQPFEGAELYGDISDSVTVDRRYLWPIAG